MKKLLGVVLMFGVLGNVLACDKNEPRCKAASELIEVLKYKEAVASIQMECRGKATEMEPEKVLKRRPAAFMGILKGTEGWKQLGTVYQMYLDEACGGDELLYLLLAGYRVAWDVALPGDKLFEGLEKAKKNGKTELEDEARFVSSRVNTVLGPILNQMVEYAQSNYDAHVKAVVSGEAIDIVNRGASCMPNPGL